MGDVTESLSHQNRDNRLVYFLGEDRHHPRVVAPAGSVLFFGGW